GAPTRSPLRGLDYAEDRMIGSGAGQLLIARVRAHAAEENSDLPLPPLEIGAKPRHLLRRRKRPRCKRLGPPTDPQATRRIGAQVLHPLRVPAGCYEVPRALELKGVDRGAAPLAALAPAHLQHPGARDAAP